MGKKENIRNYYRKKSAINHSIKSRGDRAREAYQNCFSRAPNFQGSFEEFREHIEKQFRFYKVGWFNYGEWELDHIIPLAKGGQHCVKNLQILTLQENRRKGAKLIT